MGRTDLETAFTKARLLARPHLSFSSAFTTALLSELGFPLVAHFFLGSPPPRSARGSTQFFLKKKRQQDFVEATHDADLVRQERRDRSLVGNMLPEASQFR